MGIKKGDFDFLRVDFFFFGLFMFCCFVVDYKFWGDEVSFCVVVSCVVSWNVFLVCLFEW